MNDKKDETPAKSATSGTSPSHNPNPATQRGPTDPAHPASPSGKKSGPVAPKEVLDKVRDLAACCKAGDRQQAFAKTKEIVQHCLDHCESAATTKGPALMAATPVERAEKAKADEPLVAVGDRLEEFCQHCDGGTGHPVARSFAAASTPGVGDHAAGGGWFALLLPMLLQILTDFLNKPKAA